jgi:hypothetical protein
LSYSGEEVVAKITILTSDLA